MVEQPKGVSEEGPEPRWVSVEDVQEPVIQAEQGYRVMGLGREVLELGAESWRGSRLQLGADIDGAHMGISLSVSVNQITDNTTGLQVFACRITGKNIEIQANLNVFLPENLEDF